MRGPISQSLRKPVFDYIQEQIDDKRMTLVLLKKYKHRGEWFHWVELCSKCKDDAGQGEKVLARDLYDCLHDQGVEFHVEPESASGRLDLMWAQSGKDRLAADVKLFNPRRGLDPGYLVRGVRRVYDYTKDSNEPLGYLVVFKTCEQDLAIPTQHQESSVLFITHKSQTICIIVIDAFACEPSVSKRSKLQLFEILPSQIVGSVTETQSAC